MTKDKLLSCGRTMVFMSAPDKIPATQKAQKMREIKADFEESEFRGPLFNQLHTGSPLLWEPGQVFEKHIGIDYACLSNHPMFWHFYRMSTPPVGATLLGLNFGYIWKKAKKKKALPPFQLNVFVQAKRSTYIQRATKALRQHGLASDCWCFDVTPHQQKALERLASTLGSSAVVCYAAPAFHKQFDLYDHTEHSSIVGASSFPPAGKLVGHTRWYYDRAGKFGVANPDFEKIEVPPIITQIETLAQNSVSSEESPSSALKTLADKIILTTRGIEDPGSVDTFFHFILQRNEVLAQMMFDEVPSDLINYIRVRSFCDAYKLNWFVIQ